MARIPEATPAGRPGFGGPRRISVDQSGGIAADALIDAGSALANVAAAKLDRDDRFNYALAKSSILTADIESRKALEEDADWETWEKRHQERLANAVDEATGKIRSKRDRALFEMEAKIDVERSLAEVRKLARLREVDVGRADLANGLESMQRAALETSDPATRKHLVETAQDMITGASNADLPLITAQEAKNLQVEWTEKYALGSVSMMSDEDQMKVLKNPEGTPAQFISPDVRQKMFREAESRNKIERTRRAAIDKTEAIIAKYPTLDGMGDALSEISNIKDADVQVAARAMLKERYSEMQAIDAEAHDKAVDLVTEALDDGHTLSQVEATEQWGELTATERRAARAIASGTEPVHSDSKYLEWLDLPDDEKASMSSGDLMLQYRPYLDDAHFNKVINDREIIQRAESNDAEAASTVRDGRTMNQMIDDKLIKAKLFVKIPTGRSGDGEATKTRYVNFVDTVNDRVNMEAEAKGKKLGHSRISEIIDEEIIKRAFVDRFLRSDIERLFINMTPEERRTAYVDIDDIPGPLQNEIENLARSMNFTPSERQIEIVAARLRMQASSSTSTDEEIQIIVNTLRELANK